MALTSLFVPSLEEPSVRVVSNQERNQFTISWDSQPSSGGYRVFGGFDPIHIRSLVSGTDVLPPSQTSFTFTVPPVPPGQIVYFWVTTGSAGTETFIDDLGSYALKTSESGQFPSVGTPGGTFPDDVLSKETLEIACFDDDRFYIEEIRRRARALIEATGEPADLFIKQWRGLPDPSTQEAVQLDPNHHGMTRDDRSFGTGFYPGYFPSIRVRVRFGSLPVALLDFQGAGLRPLLQNEAWTLWDPIMHENDLVVRVNTGQRYAVQSAAFSNNRGVPITQRMSLEIVTPTSPLQRVTDALLNDRWAGVNSTDFLRASFGIAADDSGAGGPDFLLLK